MANQMREALEAAGFQPTRRFPEKPKPRPKAPSIERLEREERQAADARRLDKAREGLAAMTKKGNQ